MELRVRGALDPTVAPFVKSYAFPPYRLARLTRSDGRGKGSSSIISAPTVFLQILLFVNSFRIRNSLIKAAKYYFRYIDKVKDESLVDALKHSGSTFVTFLEEIPEDSWDFAYAEGKWTVKEVVLHVCDSERVFAYRALNFARGDTQALPGMDQEAFAGGAKHAATRTPKSLIKEFKALRKATIALFKPLDDEELARSGVASGNEVSVLALGYIIAGHTLHHMEVIADKYLGAAAAR